MINIINMVSCARNIANFCGEHRGFSARFLWSTWLFSHSQEIAPKGLVQMAPNHNGFLMIHVGSRTPHISLWDYVYTLILYQLYIRDYTVVYKSLNIPQMVKLAQIGKLSTPNPQIDVIFRKSTLQGNAHVGIWLWRFTPESLCSRSSKIKNGPQSQTESGWNIQNRWILLLPAGLLLDRAGFCSTCARTTSPKKVTQVLAGGFNYSITLFSTEMGWKSPLTC